MTDRHGHIVQLSASNGGVPKLPLAKATIDTDGITADRQADLQAHGGPRRALCLFALERIQALAAEGHSIAPGKTGENITTAGIDWNRATPGTRLRLGKTVLIEITGYTEPCWKNAQWFIGGNINSINQEERPGFSRVYARVLEGGELYPDDPVELLISTPAERVERTQPRTIRWRPSSSSD
ncbi:MAG: sulfurase [Dehalococcoidia bacterium]|nr:sulfurase [Dehalococcoidia bacterium]HCV00716.1 MOSC domain-containing protein [Dehalococcoidia bacterium]|tara:strand:+ start:157 stop:702 length:546 start_codon:yes stop_codon:yes gene_type:complete